MSVRLAAMLVLAGVAVAAERPALSLTDLAGSVQTLEQFKGRLVILNFWATWCVPCRDEMPLLVSVQRRYHSKGVVVVGASADDENTQPQIKPFLEELGIGFPIWTGATTAHMEQFGLGAALPATAIIDQQGQIAFRLIGVLNRKDLERRLDYLLSGKHGRPPEPMLDTLSQAKADHGDASHEHGEEEEHSHGGVGVEGASMVPS